MFYYFSIEPPDNRLPLDRLHDVVEKKMPLGSVDTRLAIGCHEHHHSHSTTTAASQAILDKISARQAHQSPKQGGAITLLYLSALTQLTAIRSTAHQLPTIPPPPLTTANVAVQPLVPLLSSALPPPPLPVIAFTAPPSTWLGLPMAEAFKMGRRKDSVKYDASNDMMIVNGDLSQSLFLSVAKTFLANHQQLSHNELNALEFRWRQTAAGQAITLTRAEPETAFYRGKRISFQQREREIATHITENCAVETDIYNPSGESEGTLLLFAAQRAENPFRMLYDNIEGYQPPKWVENTSGVTNYMANTVTLALKPLIGGLIANYFRHKYYSSVGDTICATRQRHLSFAQIATALEVDGLGQTGRGNKITKKPIALQNLQPTTYETSYILQNRRNNIKSNLMLTARLKGRTGPQEIMVLKPKGELEFETVVLKSGTTDTQKMRVIYDKKEKIWRYAEKGNTAELDVSVKEGETFITLYGENFPIHIDAERQFHITVITRDGVKKYLPVYLDSLTKTWHLKTVEGTPFYSPVQQGIINKLKIQPNTNLAYHAVDNRHADYYGEGKIFEVRNLHDDVATTPPLYRVIEMNGELIPVRSTKMGPRGIRYTAYDSTGAIRKEYPLEWYEGRWRLERDTSPHLSPQLARSIMSDMFVKNLKESELSVPDSYGIKWANGRGYLKVRGNYVAVHKGAITQIGSSGGKVLFAAYKNKQFLPITTALWPKQSLSNTNWRAEGFLDTLKGQTKEKFQEPIQFLTIDDTAKSLFAPAATEVKITSSDSLAKKRYIVTTVNAQFVVETTQGGFNISLLLDLEAEMALSKYRRSLTGGDVQHLVALQRDLNDPISYPDSRARIDIVAAERLATGAALIGSELKNMLNEHEDGNILIVGHADFFRTSAFENNVFASPKCAYQAMVETLVPLSMQYPDAIIIPGSIYISQDIPDYMSNRALRYQQQQIRPVQDAINFSAVLVPVLHQGKFVTIARKGEYLTYHEQNATTAQPVRLTHLDGEIPAGALLKVSNVKQGLSQQTDEKNAMKTGTLFAGKTLLPNEKDQAEMQLSLHGLENSDLFFNNEFIIGDNKFLLVVEDEFVQHGGERPHVRHLAFPGNEALLDVNYYDWIIHPSAGEELDASMISAAYNYLRADYFYAARILSEVNPRRALGSYSPADGVNRYEFFPRNTERP